MAIIVGRRYRRTPILSSQFSVLELNPYWYVPESIARPDYLPKLIEDPGTRRTRVCACLQKIRVKSLNDMRSILPTYPQEARCRIACGIPGPENALGRVKFLFDNPFAVYLHDTPNRHYSLKLNGPSVGLHSD